MTSSSGARATYLAYRLGAVVARVVPNAVAEPVAEALGRAARYAMPGRRRMAERHQRRVAIDGAGAPDPAEVRRAVASVFGSYARYWFEMFRLPSESPERIRRLMQVEGYEHVEAALAAGRGAIFALPHLGGWEYAGAWIAAAHGQHPLAVVEPVEPPELFDWFSRQRRAMGMEVVALGEGTASRLLRALGHNRVVALVCDRDLTGDGVEVEFFGECTTLPAGPATLALRSGAPVLPTAVYFRPGGHHRAVVGEPIPTERQGRLRDDVARITQELAHRFEALIRESPEQWHLLQPNWPSDRG